MGPNCKGLPFLYITTLYTVQLLVGKEEQRVYAPLFELQITLVFKKIIMLHNYQIYPDLKHFCNFYQIMKKLFCPCLSNPAQVLVHIPEPLK